MNRLKFLILFLLNFSYSYSQKNIDIDFFEENEKVNLYAFVGEIISIEEFDPNSSKEEKTEIDSITGDKITYKNATIMDRAFKLKYKVLKNLYNNVKTDTIEFISYDHYGIPRFSEFKNVILYISKSQKGDYYFHQKYQYNEWIGLLNFGSEWRIEEGLKLNLKKIKLKKSAYIDLKGFSIRGIELLFPKPFYEIKKNKAIPILGFSIKNLVEYKVKSILEDNQHLIKQ